MTTTAADPGAGTRTETCAAETLAALLLPSCWAYLTPADPTYAWIIQLSKPAGQNGARVHGTSARCDRAAGAIVVGDEPLGAADGEAAAGLFRALRAAGRYPGAHYWTSHRTRYPIAFGDADDHA